MKPSIRLFFPLIGLLVSVFGAGCRVRDVREVTLPVAGLRSAEDGAKIEQVLRLLPDGPLTNKAGDTNLCLKVLHADPVAGTVRIRYDSMKVGTMNLEYALSEAGYGTEHFPAKRKSAPAAGHGTGK
ncbi:MAG: hypothetical protein ACI4QT_04720 [Kiritimatiellia bacterium]